jgi:hypothetical protein
VNLIKKIRNCNKQAMAQNFKENFPTALKTQAIIWEKMKMYIITISLTILERLIYCKRKNKNKFLLI